MRLNLLFHTLRYLKFRQIRYQLWYRVRKVIRQKTGFSYPMSIPKRGIPLRLGSFIAKPESLNADGTFTFLNQTFPFTGWSDKERDRLWSYNLNYMDFLHSKNSPMETGRGWITKFIDEAGANADGLEPYPIALRGINWIKFLSNYHPFITAEEKQRWDASLYAQYKILQDNLEYHLLGNHLLEDACSLLFAGLYFSDEALYSKATCLVRDELNEQVLSDGAHFELSPMYHQILLDRLLDCINACKDNRRFGGQEALTAFMEEKACRMLGWLETMTYRDGTIPLLNDAAYGIAPDTAELFQYAKRLGLEWKPTPLKASGYRKFTSDRLELVMDVGAIGPDYIPGHAHADTFNYELRIDGQPFIVDTGISTYNKNSRRQYERETEAHNTVTVKGESSSRVWGGFRVAERASVITLKEEPRVITAVHNGYGKKGILHRRSFRFDDNRIVIQDSLLSVTAEEGISRIMLAPDIQILSVDTNRIETNKAIISLKAISQVTLQECEVATSYNTLVPTHCIRCVFTAAMEYSITI